MSILRATTLLVFVSLAWASLDEISSGLLTDEIIPEVNQFPMPGEELELRGHPSAAEHALSKEGMSKEGMTQGPELSLSETASLATAGPEVSNAGPYEVCKQFGGTWASETQTCSGVNSVTSAVGSEACKDLGGSWNDVGSVCTGVSRCQVMGLCGPCGFNGRYSDVPSVADVPCITPSTPSPTPAVTTSNLFYDPTFDPTYTCKYLIQEHGCTACCINDKPDQTVAMVCAAECATIPTVTPTTAPAPSGTMSDFSCESETASWQAGIRLYAELQENQRNSCGCLVDGCDIAGGIKCGLASTLTAEVIKLCATLVPNYDDPAASTTNFIKDFCQDPVKLTPKCEEGDGVCDKNPANIGKDCSVAVPCKGGSWDENDRCVGSSQDVTDGGCNRFCGRVGAGYYAGTDSKASGFPNHAVVVGQCCKSYTGPGRYQSTK